MSDHFDYNDESRLRGALGSLRQAVALLDKTFEHGKCTLSASHVQDAEKLADGAGVLLSYIIGKGNW